MSTKLLGIHRCPTNASVDDAGLFNAEIDFTALQISDRLPNHWRNHGSNLGVGHQPTGTEDRPIRPTLPIMSVVATTLSNSNQPSFLIFITRSSVADDVRAGFFRSLGCLTLREHHDTDGLTCTVRSLHHGPFDRRVWVDTQAHSHVDTFVELGGRLSLSLERRIDFHAFVAM